jgi:hypothetical protein
MTPLTDFKVKSTLSDMNIATSACLWGPFDLKNSFKSPYCMQIFWEYRRTGQILFSISGEQHPDLSLHINHFFMKQASKTVFVKKQ